VRRKRVEAVRLQQKFQNDTTREKTNKRHGYPKVLSDAEGNYLCNRLKDLTRRGFGRAAYRAHEVAFILAETEPRHPRTGKQKNVGKDWFASS
jgi:hypothetical protein